MLGLGLCYDLTVLSIDTIISGTVCWGTGVTLLQTAKAVIMSLRVWLCSRLMALNLPS